MKKYLRVCIIFMILILTMMFSVNASAKTGFYGSGSQVSYYNRSGNKVKGTWFKVGKYYYYAHPSGYIAKGLTTINNKLYYFDSKGRCKTGWRKIGGKQYYFMSKTREAITGKMYKFKNGKTYAFNSKGHMLTGWQKINGYYYYFSNYMRTGWLKQNGKKYYLIKADAMKGRRASGLFSISKKLYYFDPETGALKTNTVVTVNGTNYDVDANGVCTRIQPVTPAAPVSDKMLFFLTFESGSEAYNQTGGDKGNACGAYQFDYRYSLLDFIKYSYNADKKLCAEFKDFISVSKTSLKSNKKLYTAWKKIYARNPKAFAKLQDEFAKSQYYTPVETSLLAAGIDITKRNDVVKGAVYSYSIQHGPGTAVAAVKAIKVTKTMTDATVLKKLYQYRISKFSAYTTRYKQEYQLALQYLNEKGLK